MILRSQDGHYLVVDECFIYGSMGGEGIALAKVRNQRAEKYEIH